MKEIILKVLSTIRHPDSEANLQESGMICSLEASNELIELTLESPRLRDPFMKSLVKQTTRALENAIPDMKGKISVKSLEPKSVETDGKGSSTAGVKHVIGIASGKGGVGKSTVAANLAVTLSRMGYSTGLLDADIYGPSQPIMFGVEDYRPAAEGEPGREVMIPAERYGVKVMSIGFFITPKDALAWRGPMASGALKQIAEQTRWGDLDYLLIDMPPGTGDIHLTLLQEMNISGVVIVTTPQKIAYTDAERGVALFRSDKVAVPVLGVIENMSWFTPAELPDNRYFIFGKGGGERIAREEGVELLAQIPIIQSIMDGAESGEPGVLHSKETSECYQHAAAAIVAKVG